MADPQPPPADNPERGSPPEPLHLPDHRLWLASEPSAGGSSGERWLPPLLQALSRWPAIQRLLAPDRVSFPAGQRTTSSFVQRLVSQLGLLGVGGPGTRQGDGYPQVAMPLVSDVPDAELEADDAPWWQPNHRTVVQPLGQSTPTHPSASAFADAAVNRATAPVRGGPPPEARHATLNLQFAQDAPSPPVSTASPARPQASPSQGPPSDTVTPGPSAISATEDVGDRVNSGATTTGGGPAGEAGQAPVQPVVNTEPASQPAPTSASDSVAQSSPAPSAALSAAIPPAAAAVSFGVDAAPSSAASQQPAPQPSQAQPTGAGLGQSVGQPAPVQVPGGTQPAQRSEPAASASTGSNAPDDQGPASTDLAAAASAADTMPSPNLPPAANGWQDATASRPDRPDEVAGSRSVSAEVDVGAAQLESPTGPPMAAPLADTLVDARSSPAASAQETALQARPVQDAALPSLQPRESETAATTLVTIVVDWVAGHDQAGLREQLAEAAVVAAHIEARGITVRIEQGQPVVPERHSQGEARAAADYTLWTGTGGPLSLSTLSILEGSSLVAQRPGLLRVIAAPALTRGGRVRPSAQAFPGLIFATDAEGAESSLPEAGSRTQMVRLRADAPAPAPASRAAGPTVQSTLAWGTGAAAEPSPTPIVAQPSPTLPDAEQAPSGSDTAASAAAAAGEASAGAAGPPAAANNPPLGPAAEPGTAAQAERAAGAREASWAAAPETATTTAANDGESSLQPIGGNASQTAGIVLTEGQAGAPAANAATVGSPETEATAGRNPQSVVGLHAGEPPPPVAALQHAPLQKARPTQPEPFAPPRPLHPGDSIPTVAVSSLAVVPTLALPQGGGLLRRSRGITDDAAPWGSSVPTSTAWDQAPGDLPLVREASDRVRFEDDAAGGRSATSVTLQRRQLERGADTEWPAQRLAMSGQGAGARALGHSGPALSSDHPLLNSDPVSRLTAMLLHASPTMQQIAGGSTVPVEPYAAATGLTLPHVLEAGVDGALQPQPGGRRQAVQSPALGQAAAAPAALPVPSAADRPAGAQASSAPPPAASPKAHASPESASASGVNLTRGADADLPPAEAQVPAITTPIPMPLVRADVADAPQPDASGAPIPGTAERTQSAGALAGPNSPQPVPLEVSDLLMAQTTQTPSVQMQQASAGTTRAAETITITLDWAPGADPWALPGVMNQAAAATAPLAALGLRVRFVRGRELATSAALASEPAGSPPLALYGPQGLVPLENVAVLQGATVLHATPSAARVRVARAVTPGEAPVVARRPLGSPAHEALQLVHVTVDWPQGAADPWQTGTPPTLPPDVARRLADQGVQVVLQPGRAVAPGSVPPTAPQPLSVPTPNGRVLLPEIPWLAPPIEGAGSGAPRFTLRQASTLAGATPGPLQLLAADRQADDSAPWSPARQWPDAGAAAAGKPESLLPITVRSATEPETRQRAVDQRAAFDHTGTREPETGAAAAYRSTPLSTVSRQPTTPAGPALPQDWVAPAPPVTQRPPGEQAAAWLGNGLNPGLTSPARWSLQALQRLVGSGAGGDALAPPYRPLGMNVVYFEADSDVPDAGMRPGAAPSHGWRPLPLQQLSTELDAMGARPAPPPSGGGQWDGQAFIFAEDAPDAPLAIDPATVAAAATGRGEAPAPADYTAATTTVQTAKKDVKEDKHEHPNVDVLARQVYAVIRQRLAVERERAGRRDRW